MRLTEQQPNRPTGQGEQHEQKDAVEKVPVQTILADSIRCALHHLAGERERDGVNDDTQEAAAVVGRLRARGVVWYQCGPQHDEHGRYGERERECKRQCECGPKQLRLAGSRGVWASEHVESVSRHRSPSGMRRDELEVCTV